MANGPDRGDLGAVPDPSWEEHWITWRPEAVQSRIAEAAGFGILSPVQVDAIIQHLPPPDRGADPTHTAIAEYQAAVHRFRKDAERGLISTTPTPQELAAWANAMGEALPDAFLLSLEAQAVKVGAPRVGTGPGGEVVTLPPWVPILVGKADSLQAKRKVGRPTTLDAALPALIEAARALLNAGAEQGRVVRLIDIAKQLQGRPVAGGRSASTIKRLLNGKLDVAKAHRRAMAVAAMSKSKC